MSPEFYITTVLMGYGHLRAADNVAGLGRGRLVRVDLPPFVNLADILVWKSSQDLYHVVSRTVETRLRFLFRVLERIEDIPDDSKRASMQYSTLIRFLVRTGVCRGLRRLASPSDGEPAGRVCPPRLHTFFLPGLACVYNRFPGKDYQLLCDADFHRVWAPIKPNDGDVTYLVPTAAGADRLISYGVMPERIAVTGFPLPVANTGGRDLDVLQSDVRARLERLSPQSDSPLRLVFALSGAGCYLNLLKTLIRELLPELRSGKLTLRIAAGDNRKAKAEIESHLAALNARDAEGVTILYSPDLLEAFALFNRALRESDLLITKPGELVFYAALGIPQVLLPPVGKHEFKNRAYLIENSAALDLPGAESAGAWLLAQRANGAWRRAAESAFARLPKLGAFAINEIVQP
ncbi:MAG: hypothetical protein ABSA67_04535 [Candidatus Brocadiia bacterium]|jgi:hypothetical protein